MKTCAGCGGLKELDQFNVDRQRTDGRKALCRDCERLYAAAKRERYREANAGKDPFDGKLKYCPRCGKDILRTFENWFRHATNRDGLAGLCRVCENRRVSKKDRDIIERIDYLWLREKRSGRGEWIDHGKGEWFDLLISQRGCCALSGERLTSANVSIDHIAPCSKGGTHELNNLRLVTKQVNIALQADSDEEFIAMCHRVVEWQGRKQ